MSPEILMYLILGGIILCFGVVGNIIVVIYFGVVRKCKSRNELLVFLLGVTDLIASIHNLVFDWSYKVDPYGWKFEGVTCKYVNNISFSTNQASCYVLVLMFYVRYRCIAAPFLIHRDVTKGKIFVLWLAIIITCALLRIPSILGKQYDGKLCSTKHEIVFGNGRNYLIYRLMMYLIGRLLLPLACMVYYYWRTKTCLNFSSVALNNDNVNKRNKRILTTILWLAIAFVLSVAPYEVFSFIGKLKNRAKVQVEIDQYAKYFFSAFYYLNSPINVVIYAGFIANFRHFCYKILCFRKI